MPLHSVQVDGPATLASSPLEAATPRGRRPLSSSPIQSTRPMASSNHADMLDVGSTRWLGSALSSWKGRDLAARPTPPAPTTAEPRSSASKNSPPPVHVNASTIGVAATATSPLGTVSRAVQTTKHSAIIPSKSRTNPPRQAQVAQTFTPPLEQALKMAPVPQQLVQVAPTATWHVARDSTSASATVQPATHANLVRENSPSVRIVGEHSDDSSSDGLRELEKELRVVSTMKRVSSVETKQSKPRFKPTKPQRPIKPTISQDGVTVTTDDELAELEMELGILPQTRAMSSSKSSNPTETRPNKRPAATSPAAHPRKRKAAQPKLVHPLSSSDDSGLEALNQQLGIVTSKSSRKSPLATPRGTDPPRKKKARVTKAPPKERTLSTKASKAVDRVPVQRNAAPGDDTSNDEALAELERELSIITTHSTNLMNQKPSRPDQVEPDTIDSDDSGLAALDEELVK
ncbi:hypothetical protein H310_07680 [Aphanomyces invadans]|uniref:Uncharacterized protein n=1 Tax=Aphanomyces invadans TaxID=157072 RepID=A0A024U1K4_9STRA|nr:hypothetical protein H310_07680 [Aphanomyces invadans]ETW00306.1 hypothetical protein H310_07680 [Aphanomyces invadans]|eukprot:XP_008871331.1 hypothetical protein H310_07680 [Aphanomyces invadans]